MTLTALTGANIVLADAVAEGQALLLDGDRIAGLAPADALPADCARHDLDGGWLLPGFIDVQVNGGGDVLFNDHPSVEGIRAIAAAHRRFGTTGLLPTLISDYAAVVDNAIAAGEAALADRVPGVLGIHIEGPHLNPAKKGIHDKARFAAVDADVIARLARPTLGRRVVTLAPELAPAGTVRALADAGVLVCAGHSLADYDQTRAALGEGLAGFTHLFNAMTQLLSRDPGMVGAALEDRASHFGLIVDGLHVHPAALRVALRARGIDGAMLVTDAMPPVGGTQDRFTLMGQDIAVIDGTCRGPDGTLAGSALSMVQALCNAMDLLGCDIVTASRMASGNPARFLRLGHETGAIAPGLRADLVHLDETRAVTATWIAGARADHPA
ncbi:MULTISPECIES: N-acetylglucosamine-6-phosphate deacetylase [unclassified Novosphingobium]|uniref:N-acetylglucosamine-6-phosphate deacetylase n=1 Tax=unclassified Novosphingobium TaxID=2644732 RepID=UPI000F603B80|nr:MULTISPECIES: N-acetylglucosamine-6-phosphate deacetylase [unclassified Novosphingobium]MBF5092722.1 N-acetylglucosamine-6-phosphate deacetylase [Novosphingobium sp. NBM11]RQW45004.1 N-acetylglucosamine-6-phosphate deacetylase [Novosphingobium sp. LASN5T]